MSLFGLPCGECGGKVRMGHKQNCSWNNNLGNRFSTIVIRVPIHLHKRIKSLAHHNQTSMNHYLGELIHRAIRTEQEIDKEVKEFLHENDGSA